MKRRLLTATLLLVAVGNARSAADQFVLSAAVDVDKTVTWQKKSILSGDFTCQRQREFAVLGTSSNEIVIAVFRPPSRKPVDVLRYSGAARSPDAAILTIEPLDFDSKEL